MHICVCLAECGVTCAGPDKKLKLSLNYPASVGRNMDEITRVVDALQLSAKYSVVRPCQVRPHRLACQIYRPTVFSCESSLNSLHPILNIATAAQVLGCIQSYEFH